MDPIQSGIFVLEEQRKESVFNFKVFCAAVRESSKFFLTLRRDDRERLKRLIDVLRRDLGKRVGSERSPKYWVGRVDAHGTTLDSFSKFYGAMIAFSSLPTAYFFGDQNWGITTVLGVFLVLLTKAKWGVDNYRSNLDRIKAALSELQTEVDSSCVHPGDHHVQQTA